MSFPEVALWTPTTFLQLAPKVYSMLALCRICAIQADHSFLTFSEDTRYTRVLIYVDDLIIIGNDSTNIN